ncbi:MAG TPA: histidine kinase [Albitalea sp.]|nr:histidine kinase [Albitalea sp.]
MPSSAAASGHTDTTGRAGALAWLGALGSSALSEETRRLSAGIRAVAALLCTLMFASAESRPGMAAAVVLLAYDLWAACVLWLEARGMPLRQTLAHCWIDVGWTLLMLRLTDSGAEMLVLTLVQPVVLAGVGYGVWHGLVLAVFSALGLLFDSGGPFAVGTHGTRMNPLWSVAVLGLVGAAALLARPMNDARRRIALVRGLEASLDPRRGLNAVCAALVGGLRSGTRADLVALVLPAAADAPAVVNTAADGSFRVSPQAHAQLEALLDRLPACAVTHAASRWGGLAGGTRLLGPQRADEDLRSRLAELSALLDVRSLAIVPLERYEHRHGYLLLGMQRRHRRVFDVALLAEAAPELFRILEQAMLVDRLQAETTEHERVRIGRDLHDSAIQPYVGLKFAVESVAARMSRDNPARADVDALVDLVQHEVESLRELVSGLRVGQHRGDNALVPAVRRQVRRFASLFGIEVHLDCPSEMRTSRALAGAVFHMVNEALNNVRQHTSARQVWVHIEEAGDALRLSVRDDGGARSGRNVATFHPRSLNERAAALGGSVLVHHPEGVFTEVVITLPISPLAPRT